MDKPRNTLTKIREQAILHLFVYFAYFAVWLKRGLLELVFPRRSGFRRAVSRILSARQSAGERIICLSSQYPEPVPRVGTETGSFRVLYLALHPMGFSVPPRLRLERWALTPPFHPYRRSRVKDPESTAVYSLWHSPSGRLSVSPPACIWPTRLAPVQPVTRHRALWCSDFPPPRYDSRKRFSALPKSTVL